MIKRDFPHFSVAVPAGTCQGIPMKRYGYTCVLAQGPDLLDFTCAQRDNNLPVRKIVPRDSREIGCNMLGATTPRMPRTDKNDELHLEPMNLIDGDDTTCWCSCPQNRPDVEPVWIRLDLALERAVGRIKLRLRTDGPARGQVGSMAPDPGAVEVGRALPEHLVIRLSCDGWHWETVYDGPARAKEGAFTCTFAPRRAKQVWIIGDTLPRMENFSCCFSVACVSVYDETGRDVALARYGTGATASSCLHNPAQTREAHHQLWPIHHAMGLKWARIGYHDDPVNWHWVEREKGVLALDPEAEHSIDYLLEHGVDVVLALGFGNRLYTDHPQRELPQLPQWYYENPLPPRSEEALAAWARYVRYMVEKFKDRITYFEVWNEWNIPVYWGEEPDADLFIRISRIAYRIIRELAPRAKIMMGSCSGFPWGIAGWTQDDREAGIAGSLALTVLRELAAEVDAVGFHPVYQLSPESSLYRGYVRDMEALREMAGEWGFHGEIFISEYNYGANYPTPQPPNWWGDGAESEIVKAKHVLRFAVLNAAMDIPTFFCETWNVTYALDLSLLRRTFASDLHTGMQPQPAFYALRSLATMTDGLGGAVFDCLADVTALPEGLTAADIETAALAQKEFFSLALWTRAASADDCPPRCCDLQLHITAEELTALDPMNGTAQPLVVEQTNRGTLIRGLFIKDYPVLISGCRLPRE